MVINGSFLQEKIKGLSPKEASEKILSFIMNSDKKKTIIEGIELLIQMNDDDHLQQIQKLFLREKDPQVMIMLITLLTKCYKKDGITIIYKNLHKIIEYELKKIIIEEVGKNIKEKGFQIFLEALEDRNIKTKKLGIKWLGKTKMEQAIKPLLDLIELRNKELEKTLVTSLASILKKYNLKGIELVIKEGNVNARAVIALVLGNIKSHSAKEFLSSLSKDKSPIVRKNAIKSLGKILDEGDDELVIEKLIDPNNEVKNTAVKVLGKKGAVGAIESLFSFAKVHAESKMLHKNAIEALKKIAIRTHSEDRLRKMTKTRDADIRHSAIKLLKYFRNNKNINLLMPVLNSTVPKLRKQAKSSIIHIIKKLDDKEGAIQEVKEGLKSSQWQLRKYAAKIAGKMENPELEDNLLSLLGDSKGSVRKAAVNALAKLKTSHLIDKTKSLLHHPDWRMRRSVVKLYTKIGSEEAIEALQECITDTDVYVRSWATKALGKLQYIESIDPLLDQLDSDDPKVVISAIKALGKQKNRKAMKPLMGLLMNDNWDFRKEAEKALNEIEPDWMEYM